MYNDDVKTKAIKNSTTTLNTYEEVQLAENFDLHNLAECCQEQEAKLVRAIRLARAATGKDKILFAVTTDGMIGIFLQILKKI